MCGCRDGKVVSDYCASAVKCHPRRHVIQQAAETAVPAQAGQGSSGGYRRGGTTAACVSERRSSPAVGGGGAAGQREFTPDGTSETGCGHVTDARIRQDTDIDVAAVGNQGRHIIHGQAVSPVDLQPADGDLLLSLVARTGSGLIGAV